MSETSALPLSAAPAAAEASAAAAVPAAAERCVTCGHAGALAFCPACGQAAPRGRLTMRGVVARLATDAFDLNRGLLFTALELSRRPGAAVAEYVAGRTVRYANPVRYFLLMAALSVLVYIQSGAAGQMAGELAAGFNEGARASGGQARMNALDASGVASFLGQYMNVILAVSVPFMALATRACFRRARLNYAEHLVFNLYVAAQQCLLFVAMLLVAHPFGARLGAVMQFYTAASIVYFGWAAAGFFRVRPLAAAVRTAAATVLGYALYVVAVSAAVGVFLATRGIAGDRRGGGPSEAPAAEAASGAPAAPRAN
jgi:Protein of unknown function (DUF3667)